MMRCVVAVAVLCWAAPGLLAEEPPRELKAMIEQAEEYLKQGKYVDYYKLTMHPEMRQAAEKGGVTMFKMGLAMEKNTQAQTVFKTIFAACKKSQCQLNGDKTVATFTVPREVEKAVGSATIEFELVDKKWYLSPK